MSEVHVSRNGVSFGPYEESQATALFASGNIAPTDLVWKEGMPAWREAVEIFGVRSVPPAVRPPPISNPTAAVIARPATNQPRQAYETNTGAHRQATTSLEQSLPPKLHWGLVLLFTVLTVGIFALVWIFIQSNWIKKLDPASNATNQFIGYVALLVVGQILGASDTTNLQGIGGVLILCSNVLLYFGIFSMRRSMLNYFNNVEPIGLKLSIAYSFIFSIFYFQSKMTQIAKWRTTGILEQQ